MKTLLTTILLFAFALPLAAQQNTKMMSDGKEDSCSFAATKTTPWYTFDEPQAWQWWTILSTTNDTAYVRSFSYVRPSRKYAKPDTTYIKPCVFQPEYSSDIDTSGTIHFRITQDGKYWEAQFMIYSPVVMDAVQFYRSFLRVEDWYVRTMTGKRQ